MAAPSPVASAVRDLATGASSTPLRTEVKRSLRAMPPAKRSSDGRRPATSTICSRFARSAHAIPSTTARARCARRRGSPALARCERASAPDRQVQPARVHQLAAEGGHDARCPRLGERRFGEKPCCGARIVREEDVGEPVQCLAHRPRIALEHPEPLDQVASGPEMLRRIDHRPVDDHLDRHRGAGDRGRVAGRERARPEQAALRVGARDGDRDARCEAKQLGARRGDGPEQGAGPGEARKERFGDAEPLGQIGREGAPSDVEKQAFACLRRLGRDGVRQEQADPVGQRENRASAAPRRRPARSEPLEPGRRRDRARPATRAAVDLVAHLVGDAHRLGQRACVPIGSGEKDLARLVKDHGRVTHARHGDSGDLRRPDLRAGKRPSRRGGDRVSHTAEVQIASEASRPGRCGMVPGLERAGHLSSRDVDDQAMGAAAAGVDRDQVGGSHHCAPRPCGERGEIELLSASPPGAVAKRLPSSAQDAGPIGRAATQATRLRLSDACESDASAGRAAGSQSMPEPTRSPDRSLRLSALLRRVAHECRPRCARSRHG